MSRRTPQDCGTRFEFSTRYCPECLAGDTPVEKAHGGAWRRSWRLPVVFACTRHQRLLEHLCPGCLRPACETAAGTAKIPLIPGLKIRGLHPAQCRTSDASGNSGVTRGTVTACGARLDRAALAASVPGAVLDLQERLITLLAAHGPQAIISAASPAEPAQYLTDLRLLTILIGHSWPKARHLLPFPPLADAIDQHITLQSGRDEPSASQRPQLTGISALARPLDPAAGAGLLLIADQILRLPALPEIREAIHPLLPSDWVSVSRLTRAMHLLDSARPGCSPGLLKAVTPLVRAYPRQGLKGVRAPEITSSIAPENIPAQLPGEYFDRHLRHLEGVPRGLICRIASIRLVQMITGGPLIDAADFLGITTGHGRAGRIYSSREIIKRARSQPDPGAFDAAVEKIAAEISTAGHLINYKHRRDTLRTWAIGSQDWLEVLDHSQAAPGNHLPLGDRERQWASVIVWAEITQGEHVFAPPPIRDQQAPQTRQDWSRKPHPRRWPLNPETSAAPPSRFYLALRNTLTSYAAELAARIDNTVSAAQSRPGTRQAN